MSMCRARSFCACLSEKKSVPDTVDLLDGDPRPEFLFGTVVFSCHTYLSDVIVVALVIFKCKNTISIRYT